MTRREPHRIQRAAQLFTAPIGARGRIARPHGSPLRNPSRFRALSPAGPSHSATKGRPEPDSQALQILVSRNTLVRPQTVIPCCFRSGRTGLQNVSSLRDSSDSVLKVCVPPVRTPADSRGLQTSDLYRREPRSTAGRRTARGRPIHDRNLTAKHAKHAKKDNNKNNVMTPRHGYLSGFPLSFFRVFRVFRGSHVFIYLRSLQALQSIPVTCGETNGPILEWSNWRSMDIAVVGMRRSTMTGARLPRASKSAIALYALLWYYSSVAPMRSRVGF